ncbi:hypothetical protein O8C79_07090 [Aliarcobacter butzleri]|uniref:hypothetical protein n=1 Tax=Aliarcobacter butzleri TaxID=28197 RepID=UPI00263DCCA6|nr:hypothetical protein [Aliarcobacter butzleri]MDN5105049.1 hypothetical protein [Aliarcobacter butzleri]
MNGNVFMISDASYCSLTKIASLSVFCSHTGKTYNKILNNIQNCFFAETAALLFSIKMAIELNYSNTVFIYDNITINVNLIRNMYSHKFQHMQFLWLKRDNLQEVDIVARKNLKLARDNYGTELLNNFIELSIESKIKAIMYSTKNQREYEILNQFIKNEFTLDSLNEINIKKTQTFRYLYHLLDSKDKIDFYEYIIRVVPKIKNISDFKYLPKNYDLIEFVLKISKVINYEKLAS